MCLFHFFPSYIRSLAISSASTPAGRLHSLQAPQQLHYCWCSLHSIALHRNVTAWYWRRSHACASTTVSTHSARLCQVYGWLRLYVLNECVIGSGANKPTDCARVWVVFDSHMRVYMVAATLAKWQGDRCSKQQQKLNGKERFTCTQRTLGCRFTSQCRWGHAHTHSHINTHGCNSTLYEGSSHYCSARFTWGSDAYAVAAQHYGYSRWCCLFMALNTPPLHGSWLFCPFFPFCVCVCVCRLLAAIRVKCNCWFSGCTLESLSRVIFLARQPPPSPLTLFFAFLCCCFASSMSLCAFCAVFLCLRIFHVFFVYFLRAFPRNLHLSCTVCAHILLCATLTHIFETHFITSAMLM